MPLDTQSGLVETNELRDTLSAAFDANSGAPETPPASAAPAVDTTTPAEDKSNVSATPDKPSTPRDDGRDEHGRFAKKDGDPAVAAAAQDAGKPGDTPPPVTELEAPQHWPLKDRELFAKQTPEGRAFLMDRHKAMEADYTRKTQEIAPVRRMKEELDVMLAPYRDKYQMQGLDDVGAIRQLVAAHAFLERDPKGALEYLAKSYGVDIGQIGQGSDQAPLNHEIQKVQSEVAQLRAAEQARVTAAQQQEQQAALQTVQSFAEEKDAQGQSIRPYFDDVAQEIKALLSLKPGPKTRQDLQDAYDRAIYANPDIRQKLIAAETAKRQAADEAERKRKVEEARRATGGDVTGQGGVGIADTKEDSIRASLSRAWDGARI